jgi:hypothetical protein
MKQIILLTIIVLLINACSAAPAASPTATVISIQDAVKTVSASVALTSTASTPTKTAFENIDIGEILLKPGDLPSNFEFGQVKYDWPIDTNLPMSVKPDNLILQMFKEKGDSFNIPHFSMLAFYNAKSNADKSYETIINAFDFKKSDPSVAGERSSILHYQAKTDVLTFEVTIIVFQRCNSLAVIRVYDFKDNDIFAYAKGLDKRINKIACQ